MLVTLPTRIRKLMTRTYIFTAMAAKIRIILEEQFMHKRLNLFISKIKLFLYFLFAAAREFYKEGYFS